MVWTKEETGGLGGVSVKRGIAELDLKYGLPPGPEQHLARSRVLNFQANFIFVLIVSAGGLNS